MTDNEKLTRLKTILGETSKDTLLSEYLAMAKDEIINWIYINSSVPENATMPSKYDQVQIQACIEGFSIRGAEGESSHSENGISRQFVYEDMLSYIHSHVFQEAGL